MKAKLQEWGAVVVLALIPALPLLAGGGLVNTRAGGDSPFLLVRVQQMVLNLRAGVFPVRWMPQAAYGLGYPFFNFYASLPYYLAAAFKLLGFGYIAAIQLTQALGFLFAAVAMYGFCRQLGHSRSTGLLVTCVYSCAPFHMVNVYVRGDSLSEFYAFVFFPLILWSLLRLKRRPGARNMAWAAIAYAGLVVTHHISAAIFSPFVLLYVICIAVWDAPASEPVGRSILRSALSLAAGLLLSAWFWLPVLAERGSVSLNDMTTGYFHYAQHFRDLLNTARAAPLVQPSVVFDWAITASKQPFSMGLVQALLAAAGLVAVCVWWMRRRRVELHSALVALLLVGSTFMITPWSQPVWERVPLLPLVQFPWRFLSLQAVGGSLLVAYLIPRGRRGRWLGAALGLAMLVAMLAGLHPERLDIHEADVTAQRLMWYEYFTANVGTTIRQDWLPRWVDPRPYTSEGFWRATAGPEGAFTKPKPLALAGQVESAQLLSCGPISELWSVDVTSAEALLGFQTYYYPGWEARVDGRQVGLEPLAGLGYIGLRLAQGRHQVSLHLGRTGARAVAEALSLVTLIVLLVAVLLGPGQRFVVATSVASSSRRALYIIAALLGALLLLAVMARLLPSHEPQASGLDLSMDFDRIPYLHHNSQGVRFGSAARLISYELSSEAVQTGQDLRVTMHWSDVQGNGLAVRVALVSPAQHLFGVQQAIAANEEPLIAGAVKHALSIPLTTPRGVYLLSVRVYGAEEEVLPVTARGETLGTTYLLPVQVSGEQRASEGTPTLLRFGDRIALSAVQTAQQVAGTLQVTLTWNVLATPQQNFKTALRLKDSSGWEVARLDTQPGYGFYPTSMWRAGELVTDRYELLLDEGTPPGTGYSLDVTLYESASLRPIGTARIADVAITQPDVRPGATVQHTFGPALALSAGEVAKASIEQGEQLMLRVKWTVMAHPDTDYQCQIALLDRGNHAVVSETLPVAADYPSSQWPKDALVAVRYGLRIPPVLPAGQYRVALALRDFASGTETDTYVLPGPVQVVQSTRNFAIPEMQTQVGADFGGQVRLLGYDLQRTGNELRITLHWQSLAAMNRDYKAFLHLFDPGTETIVAQQDLLAGGNGHPTSRWVQGEAVSDPVSLGLEGVANGTYRLALGLYYLEARLPVTAPSGWTVSSDRLLLGESVRLP